MNDTHEREWVIYREFTTRQVFTGIKASSRDEAIAQWERGAGELAPEREAHRTSIDAIDIRIKSCSGVETPLTGGSAASQACPKCGRATSGAEFCSDGNCIVASPGDETQS